MLDTQGRSRCQDAGVQRVVLVVIFEHPRSADRTQVLECVEPCLDSGDVALVRDLDDRIGLVAADDEAVQDLPPQDFHMLELVQNAAAQDAVARDREIFNRHRAETRTARHGGRKFTELLVGAWR